MQFNNPIIKSLILYDNNGNAVISLGPGPFITIVNPTTGAELDLDAGTTYPEIIFWNQGKTANARVNLDPVDNLSLRIATFGAGNIELVDGDTNLGFALDGSVAELKAYNAGNLLDWVALTLQNGWAAKAGYYKPAYKFTADGRIELRGVMTGGTNVDNTIVAIMPLSPAKLDVGHPVVVGGGTVNARVFYNTDGKLYIYGCAGAVDIGINGMRFSWKADST